LIAGLYSGIGARAARDYVHHRKRSVGELQPQTQAHNHEGLSIASRSMSEQVRGPAR
jgi:hypothetical protein